MQKLHVLVLVLVLASLWAGALLLALARLRAGCAHPRAPPAPVTHPPATMFKAYMKDFGKHYKGEELMKRFEIFKNSLKEIDRMNRKSGARFGLTKFSDRAQGELPRGAGRALGGCTPAYQPCGAGPHDGSDIDYHLNETLDDRFDWRERGFVSPVLDQKLCNGCWAFGTVGAMETRAAVQHGALGARRSVQELMDCSKKNRGCERGNVFLALKWLCDNQWGIVPEQEYRLRDVTQSCRLHERPVGLQVRQFWKLCRMDERLVPRLVRFHGPLVVVVNADPWRGYVGGVIQRACVRRDGATEDHVVQVVGYDLSAPVPYYIVRNSWGADFGLGGYVHLAVGGNVCGVADEGVLLDVYKDPY